MSKSSTTTKLKFIIYRFCKYFLDYFFSLLNILFVIFQPNRPPTLVLQMKPEMDLTQMNPHRKRGKNPFLHPQNPLKKMGYYCTWQLKLKTNSKMKMKLTTICENSSGMITITILEPSKRK